MNRTKALDLFIVAAAAVLTVVLLLLPHLNQRMMVQTVSVVQSNKPTVVLDPGHGGFDGGAQGNSLSEKEINLAIAEQERLLCQLFGFHVVMTRESDISIHEEGGSVREKKRSDLHRRLELMVADPTAIVVSIHLNKFPANYVHGAQMFYAPKAEGSKELAQTLQDSFRLLLQPENDRVIKKADKDLFILYNNDTTPAVMVECGFISNVDEARRLGDKNYQRQVAMTICYALMKFQNSGESEVVPLAP